MTLIQNSNSNWKSTLVQFLAPSNQKESKSVKQSQVEEKELLYEQYHFKNVFTSKLVF